MDSETKPSIHVMARKLWHVPMEKTGTDVQLAIIHSPPAEVTVVSAGPSSKLKVTNSLIKGN